MEKENLHKIHIDMLKIQLENLEIDMDGYAGCNWKDEYKGYNNLSTMQKINVVSSALEQYKD